MGAYTACFHDALRILVLGIPDGTEIALQLRSILQHLILSHLHRVLLRKSRGPGWAFKIRAVRFASMGWAWLLRRVKQRRSGSLLHWAYRLLPPWLRRSQAVSS